MKLSVWVWIILQMDLVLIIYPKEFKDQATGEEEDQILPKVVGGSKVHLLLGIKNTNLDPVLVKVLPSGIAVYLSPFKDVYGSRLIFAGPYKSQIVHIRE